MNNLYTDVGYLSINKYGEQLCGDHVDVVAQGEHSTIVVLADGLGSGVKASILSTLTSKIISTMLAAGLSLEDCVATIAATLPVDLENQVAYCTFSIIHIVENKEAEIIQYDNPQMIMLRDGVNYELPKTMMEMQGKIIYKSKVSLQRNDVFILMSDGAPYASPGKKLNFNWQREHIIEFMEMMNDPEFTAKTLSTILLDECKRLYDNKPGDDTTICTVKIRSRKPVNIMIGPPANREDDKKMMSLFFSKGGKHIICGGTTSMIASEYLDKPLDTGFPVYYDSEIPPTSKLEGVDLVTEGVITISKVLFYAKNYLDNNEQYVEWSYNKDGASLIARLLFEEATDINIFVGKAVNPEHQLPGSGVAFDIKMQQVDELSKCLRQMRKNVKVSYF